jgi:6-phosphofructokinase 1
MSGRTNMVVGFWNHQFTHVPISLAASQRKKIDPKGTLWNSVLASTPPLANRGNVLRKRKFGKV